MMRHRELYRRRARRTRKALGKALGKAGSGRLRLSVCRSHKHIYAQVIDDARGQTVLSVSSRGQKQGGNTAAAAVVGKNIADKAQQAGIKQVVFDRGGRLYHGRIRALAEAARSGGLEF